MKLICPLSGVSYKTDIGYGHGKVKHPIFQLSLQALLGQNLDPFTTGRLTPTETHLFGCALLDKLPIIWERPLIESVCIPYWKRHIEQLATIVARHDPTKYRYLPKYKIADYNCDLSTLANYLAATDRAILEYREQDNIPDYLKNQTEEMILKLLRNSVHKATNTRALPKLMADWARDAAMFPRTQISLRDGKKYTVADHWHEVVTRIFAAQHPVHILSEDITLGDISELVDHCEEHLDIGSIHSLALLKKLREVQVVLHEFKNDIREKQNSMEVMQGLASEDTTPALVNKVYKEGEPRREDYASIMAFTRAKLAWTRRQPTSIIQNTGVSNNESK